MDQVSELEYEITEGCAKFVFPRNLSLLLVPYRNREIKIKGVRSLILRWLDYMRNREEIAGLNSVILLKKGAYIAMAIDRTAQGGARPQGSGFWSKGDIEQEELAAYWNKAIQSVEHLCEDHEIHIIAYQGEGMRQRLEQGTEKGLEMHIHKPQKTRS